MTNHRCARCDKEGVAEKCAVCGEDLCAECAESRNKYNECNACANFLDKEYDVKEVDHD